MEVFIVLAVLMMFTVCGVIALVELTLWVQDGIDKLEEWWRARSQRRRLEPEHKPGPCESMGLKASNDILLRMYSLQQERRKDAQAHYAE